MKWRNRTCRLVLAATLCTASALAEPSASEKAAAEALFQQATELMAAKQVAKACAKFEASQQLDPALGTMLRLADCFDRIGKSASAWALFQEASSTARATNQPEREQIAEERAGDLAKRLSKLEIKVNEKTQPAELQIRLNGVSIPPASWNTPIPVDPGPQRIEVSAPQYMSWSGSVEVPKGPASRSIQVPALRANPTESRPAQAAQPAKDEPKPASLQRTFGYVAAGVGLLGLGVGGFLGYRAYDLNRESLDECRSDDPNACTASGVEIRESAQTHATAATVVLGAGAALVGTGVVLVLTAPRTERKPEPNVRLTTALSSTSGRVTLEGAW